MPSPPRLAGIDHIVLRIADGVAILGEGERYGAFETPIPSTSPIRRGMSSS
jgi:hypothetical protein